MAKKITLNKETKTREEIDLTEREEDIYWNGYNEGWEDGRNIMIWIMAAGFAITVLAIIAKYYL